MFTQHHVSLVTCYMSRVTYHSTLLVNAIYFGETFQQKIYHQTSLIKLSPSLPNQIITKPPYSNYHQTFLLHLQTSILPLITKPPHSHFHPLSHPCDPPLPRPARGACPAKGQEVAEEEQGEL